MKKSLYADAGVDVNNSNKVIGEIKDILATTKIKGSSLNLNSFGNCFDLTQVNIKDPVLVNGCDGVGTKILLSIESQNYSNIGIDLVAMCVNDVIATHATGLYFLDYYASSKLDNHVFKQVINSIAKGCIEANIALIGGENAEMRGMYHSNHFDIVGTCVGVVSKQELSSKQIKQGQQIIGIKSNGLHANGFSLVRKILFEDNNYKLSDKIESLNNLTLEQELLKPTKIYVSSLNQIKQVCEISGCVHVTGGGFNDNFKRILTNNLGVKINLNSWEVNPIFKFMAQVANVDIKQFYDVFNMGIGFGVIVDESNVEKILSLNSDFVHIGEITNSGKVELVHE